MSECAHHAAPARQILWRRPLGAALSSAGKSRHSRHTSRWHRRKRAGSPLGSFWMLEGTRGVLVRLGAVLNQVPLRPHLGEFEHGRLV